MMCVRFADQKKKAAENGANILNGKGAINSNCEENYNIWKG